MLTVLSYNTFKAQKQCREVEWLGQGGVQRVAQGCLRGTGYLRGASPASRRLKSGWSCHQLGFLSEEREDQKTVRALRRKEKEIWVLT